METFKEAESFTYKVLNTSGFIFIFTRILSFRLHSFAQPSPCICPHCFSLGLSYLFLSWRHQTRRSSLLFAFPFSYEAPFCYYLYPCAIACTYIPVPLEFFSSDKFWLFFFVSSFVHLAHSAHYWKLSFNVEVTLLLICFVIPCFCLVC